MGNKKTIVVGFVLLWTIIKHISCLLEWYHALRILLYGKWFYNGAKWSTLLEDAHSVGVTPGRPCPEPSTPGSWTNQNV